MIELPKDYGPGEASPQLIDFGFLQRGPFGAETKRINRKGNRYMVGFSFGPFYAEVGNRFVGLLIAAKSQGIRLPYPLQESQGSPGVPVVDGAGQQGRVLNIRGLAAGYTCRAGYWLSIENAAGRHYLDNVEVGGRANAAGQLTITLANQLRHPFANGAKIHLAKPMIEGLIDGDSWGWQLSVDQVIPITFTVEEAE